MANPPVGPHVESFFVKLTDSSAARAVWIRFTILIPQTPAPPAVSVWFTRIVPNNPRRSISIRNSAPLHEAKFTYGQAGLSIGPCVFTPGHTHGKLKDAFGNEVAWDLSWDADAGSVDLFPKPWMYTAPLPRSKTAAPVFDATANGHITMNGAAQDVDGVPMMQGHNWGANHAAEWAWGHCTGFDEHPDTVFEGLSARVEIAGRLTPFLSCAVLRHEGREIRFDSLKTLLGTDMHADRHSWSFRFRNKEVELYGMMLAHRHDFAGLFYTRPDGTHLVCKNSNLANVNMELTDAKTGDRIAKFSTVRRAMLELVARETWFDVCVYVPELSLENERGAL